MSRRLFSSTASLINELLDRHERSGGTTRPIASIDIDGFATVDQRDAFDEALEALERAGGVDLVRKGTATDRIVTGVRLRDAPTLYGHVRRRPATQEVDEALADLRRRHAASDGAAQLLESAASAWRRGVSFIGISRNDARTLGQVIALAEAMHARSTQAASTEIDFRSFSRLAVGDSKALERNVRSVTSAMPILFGPDGASQGLEPEEHLGSFGITRLPQPMLMRGPVTVGGAALPAMPFVGIPVECAGTVELSGAPDYVITIENYTSFVRYVREVAVEDDGLVVFSGGFPSRSALDAIVRLAEAAERPTFHWGDMDAGGVRIFHHIERRLASIGVELRPHMMDPDLLRRFGVPIPDASRATGDTCASAVDGLAQLIRESGLVHEQEELTPHRPQVASVLSNVTHQRSRVGR